MRIKSLTLSGFKSFCDNTKVLFDNALTAVVGPNGCGKSNIVDAIRWGLGEQSAKNLRGRGMDDVIFNGSEKRGPQSLAEVTITFDNTDGLSHPLYVDYPEVSVTRRLHRDGTSEYLINKTPCRLKDITDLFLGTGGGARAYSIIEQGRIGLIVSSRSEDRRAMFEEAAGITRFKKARATALRKMELTQQNLLRITDVIREMDRNLASLRKQARKAERYKQYAAEQMDAELYVAAHRYLEILTTQKTVAAQLGDAQSQAHDAHAAVEALDANATALRLAETQARTALEAAKSRAFEADSAIAMLESENRHYADTLARIRREEAQNHEHENSAEQKRRALQEERAILHTRLDALQDDAQGTTAQREEAERRAEEARTRLEEVGRDYDAKRDQLSRARARHAGAQTASENLEQRIAEYEARLEHTLAERRTLSEKHAQLAEGLAALRQRNDEAAERREALQQLASDEGQAFETLRHEMASCDEERHRVRDTLHRQDARLRSLQEMHEGLSRHDSAVKDAIRALQEDGAQSYRGLLIDFIECPEAYEVPLAAALADRLQALIAADLTSGFSMLTWLKEHDIGRVSALALQNPVRTPTAPLPQCDGLQGRLLDFLRIDPAAQDTVASLIGNVFVVDTVETARAQFAQSQGQAAFVTLDGQYIDALGVMRGGRSTSPGADLLGQKRQIRELAAEVTQLQAQHSALEERFENLRTEMERRAAAAETARRDAQQSEFTLSEISKDLARTSEDLDILQDRQTHLDADVQHQEQRLQQTRNDHTSVVAQRDEAQREIATVEQAIAEQSTLLNAYRDEAERLAAAVSDARVRQAQFQQQYQSAVERSQQIAQHENELDDQSARLARRQQELAREWGTTAGKLVANREKRGAQMAAIDTLAQEVEACVHALAAHTEKSEAAEQALKAQRSDASAKEQRVSEIKIAQQKVHSDMAHLQEAAAEKHNIDLRFVLSQYHLLPIPGASVHARIAELRHIIDRMGPTNPDAITECAALEERFERMSAQRADIEQAIADLEQAIARMDKESRKKFKEAFAVINEKFQEIFPRLFKGGQARLQLSDPDNLLETGVDIIAQPPGKKLGNIELMSGGEKALTAVSLLFAIFLYRPSPFCLLDEVDAPLDEANVGRFVDLVQEMTSRSQFIVITHSKVTMEGADALYGVTMQEPGVSKLISVKLVDKTAGTRTPEHATQTA
ncbi:MAG: chromosome segregation protein SMC [Proteobacteria bacterium]|nr:chromosome segregation protein SMC [Pseudomonadota bacterium]